MAGSMAPCKSPAGSFAEGSIDELAAAGILNYSITGATSLA